MKKPDVGKVAEPVDLHVGERIRVKRRAIEASARSAWPTPSA